VVSFIFYRSDVGLSAEELSEAKLLAADYIDQYVPTNE